MEKFSKSYSIFLYLSFKLKDKLVEFSLTLKHIDLSNILSLSSLLTCALGSEWVAIINELKILNLVGIGSIDLNNRTKLLIIHGKAKIGKGLSELLRRHLEVLVAIPVLEETLRVESVSLEPFSECIDD